MDEIIRHLAIFVSRLWQIHIFGEGNTRTTAVFFIKYLRTLGFDVTNDIFAENAWYFRNALVRANYNDLKKNIHETTEYLELFLRNLLLNEKNELHNRSMHVSGGFRASEKANIYDIYDIKANISSTKANINDVKANIQRKLENIDGEIFHKTVVHIMLLYDECATSEMFSRKDVENITGLKGTRAYEIVKLLLDNDMIRPVKGHGKGKYCFK